MDLVHAKLTLLELVLFFHFELFDVRAFEKGFVRISEKISEHDPRTSQKHPRGRADMFSDFAICSGI